MGGYRTVLMKGRPFHDPEDVSGKDGLFSGPGFASAMAKGMGGKCTRMRFSNTLLTLMMIQIQYRLKKQIPQSGNILPA
jgi:hypothetical protein